MLKNTKANNVISNVIITLVLWIQSSTEHQLQHHERECFLSDFERGQKNTNSNCSTTYYNFLTRIELYEL